MREVLLRKRIILFSIFLLGILTAIFIVRYEISINEKSKIADDVPELVFSRESGFYDDF